jgi:hypothetical protein
MHLLSKKKERGHGCGIIHNKTLLVMQTQQRSRLMRLSWEIQKRKNRNRSKALVAAWAIFLNEDITVFHLTRKHSHERYANKTQPEHLTLF